MTVLVLFAWREKRWRMRSDSACLLGFDVWVQDATAGGGGTWDAATLEDLTTVAVLGTGAAELARSGAQAVELEQLFETIGRTLGAQRRHRHGRRPEPPAWPGPAGLALETGPVGHRCAVLLLELAAPANPTPAGGTSAAHDRGELAALLDLPPSACPYLAGDGQWLGGMVAAWREGFGQAVAGAGRWRPWAVSTLGSTRFGAELDGPAPGAQATTWRDRTACLGVVEAIVQASEPQAVGMCLELLAGRLELSRDVDRDRGPARRVAQFAAPPGGLERILELWKGWGQPVENLTA